MLLGSKSRHEIAAPVRAWANAPIRIASAVGAIQECLRLRLWASPLLIFYPSPPLRAGLLPACPVDLGQQAFKELSAESLKEIRRQLAHFHSLLLPGVAITHGDGFVFQ